jgi:hypothetical protein
VSALAEARQTLLVATAAEIGRRLFALQRDELRREGRALAGGWPGTIREARALAVTLLAPAFAQNRMSAPTTDEVGWAMHTAYDEARRAWRTSSVHDD